MSNFPRQGDDRDHLLALFLSGMSPQSLTSLEIFRDAGIGPETFQALNIHAESLRELKLIMKSEALPHLGFLAGCTAVETLKLEDMEGYTDMMASQNDAYLALVAWLQKCKRLRELEILGFLSAASIIEPVLTEHGIELSRLNVDSYLAKDHRSFHRALVHQDKMYGLFLQGESEGMTRDDVDVLVESLQQLGELRELELRGISDFLVDGHINKIVGNLPYLEDLYIGGLSVTDDALEKAGELSNLKSITFAMMSSFTVDGLMTFISKLGPGNEGLVVQVDNADPNGYMTEEEQALINEMLIAKVGGRFEYTLFRGMASVTDKAQSSIANLRRP